MWFYFQSLTVSTVQRRMTNRDGSWLCWSTLTCSPTDFLCSLKDCVDRPSLARPDGAVVLGAAGVSSSWKSSTSKANCEKQERHYNRAICYVCQLHSRPEVLNWLLALNSNLWPWPIHVLGCNQLTRAKILSNPRCSWTEQQVATLISRHVES